jgi:hypothetical protein
MLNEISMYRRRLLVAHFRQLNHLFHLSVTKDHFKSAFEFFKWIHTPDIRGNKLPHFFTVKGIYCPQEWPLLFRDAILMWSNIHGHFYRLKYEPIGVFKNEANEPNEESRFYIRI